MTVYLKNKFNPKKAARLSPSVEDKVNTEFLIKKIHIDLKDIFNQASRYPLKQIKEKLFKITPGNQLSTQKLERAYLFASRYFKAEDMLYHLLQVDKGKNFELAADFKTTLVSPVLDTAKLIPVPIVGNVIAAGGKKVFKSRSDKERINRANQKLACMLISDELVDLMMTLFVKIHIKNIKKNKINQSYSFLKKELDIFFSIAKKEMEPDSEPENLEDFWANIFSIYLQNRINPCPKYQPLKYKFWVTQSSNDNPIFDAPSLTRFLNEDLDILLDEKRLGPVSLVHPTEAALDPILSAPNPQPGPEITCTLNPTLSPQYLPQNENHPNSLIMNVVIPDNQGNNPITLFIPSTNQPVLINLLPATKSAVYTPHASTSITYPSVLSNSSPQATIPSLNPSTNITLSDRAEKNSLPTHQTTPSEETLNPVNHDVTLMTNVLPSPSLITTPVVPMASSSMSKAETPQLISKGSIHPPVNLNQLQACVEIMAYIGSVLLAKKNQERYTKQDLLNKKIDQDKKIPKYAMAKPNYSSFFPCGVTTQQINPGISPCLSPAAV